MSQTEYCIYSEKWQSFCHDVLRHVPNQCILDGSNHQDKRLRSSKFYRWCCLQFSRFQDWNSSTALISECLQLKNVVNCPLDVHRLSSLTVFLVYSTSSNREANWNHSWKLKRGRNYHPRFEWAVHAVVESERI